MEGNNNIFEENHMLVSEGNCEPTDNTSKNVKEFSSSVELVGLMNKGVEAFVDSFSDHLSSWYEL